jgi:hypothetical protein
MANVNDNGGTHASFNESASYSSTNRDAAGNGAVLFWPYDGGKPRETLKQAMAIIQHSVVGKVGQQRSAANFSRVFQTIKHLIKFGVASGSTGIHIRGAAS